MQEHIRRVVARRRPAGLRLQHQMDGMVGSTSSERAETVPVYRGKRGAGKGTLGNAMMRLFGQHAIHISSTDHLSGRFNAHMRDCCFLFADEAYWPGNKAAEGTLQRLITEEDLFVEAKRRDGVMVPNMLHIMMASNEDWVVPAGEAERRYAVFDVSDRYLQDKSMVWPALPTA